MARHYPNALMCRNLHGKTHGLVCANCEGRCILCDSQADLFTKVLVCDECSQSKLSDKCLICQSQGVSTGYYCEPCVELEHDRDGCPRITSQLSQKNSKHFAGLKKSVPPQSSAGGTSK